VTLQLARCSAWRDQRDTFYLVRRGHVSIEVHQAGHGPIVIETVGPGDVWAGVGSSLRTAARFDARVLETVGALAIDGACLRSKCLEDPVLGFALLSRVTHELVRRLQSTRVRLLDLYGDHVTSALELGAPSSALTPALYRVVGAAKRPTTSSHFCWSRSTANDCSFDRASSIC